MISKNNKIVNNDTEHIIRFFGTVSIDNNVVILSFICYFSDYSMCKTSKKTLSQQNFMGCFRFFL